MFPLSSVFFFNFAIESGLTPGSLLERNQNFRSGNLGFLTLGTRESSPVKNKYSCMPEAEKQYHRITNWMIRSYRVGQNNVENDFRLI